MTDHPSPHPATRQLHLSDTDIGLPKDLDADAIYDVFVNGSHVWSLQPSRDGRASGDYVVVPWPQTLRRHLLGRADVVVRDNLTAVEVAVGHRVFQGAANLQVDVTDKAGRPLILDKYGKLIRPLSSEGQTTIDELMDHVERLLQVMNATCGVPAFIAYGTLLGAVRNGRLIGHDNDVDLGYVSSHESPVDVVRESYRIERALAAAGWWVRRGSGTRLNVRVRLSDDTVRYIDIFTSHWVEGVFYMPQDTGFRIGREAILPLTTVELAGRRLPAPADSEGLLALTYGEGWRTPDPSFMYDTPRWLARRIGGWFGGLRSGRKQWDTFYAAHRKLLPSRRSQFAAWVQGTYPAAHPVVDLGTGNGRDALWFARQGRAVTGIDYSAGVLGRSLRRASLQGLDVRFEVLNLNDTRQVMALGTRLSRAAEPVDLYARFLLHAMAEPGRDNLYRLASMSLRRGGRLFLEFRTTKDARRSHHFDSGYRYFLDPDEVVARITERGGTVLHRSSGTGLAPFEDEDPHVARIVAAWCEQPQGT